MILVLVCVNNDMNGWDWFGSFPSRQNGEKPSITLTMQL